MYMWFFHSAIQINDEFIKTASISLLASVDGFQVAKLSLGGSSKHISKSDGFSVLVQTDKGIYKAGQTGKTSTWTS